MEQTQTLKRSQVAHAAPLRLLSTDEAARHCGVSAAYIRYAANIGILAHVRIGVAYGFHQFDLNIWNATRTEKRNARLIRHATPERGDAQ